MDILICTHEKDPSPTLEGVKAYFSQLFPTEEFECKALGTAHAIDQANGFAFYPESFFDIYWVPFASFPA